MSTQILRILKEHSKNVFDLLSIELSETLETNFNKILDEAVNRMETEEKTDSNDIYEAKTAFTTFIKRMYNYREKRSGKKDIVRYTALKESKDGICPLWPIC